MRARRSIRLPARSVARMLRARRAPLVPPAPRAVRALLMGVMLASVLIGGDCSWAFSSKTSDDNRNDGGTTVVVTDLTMGDGAVGEAVLDPSLLELGECLIEFAGPEEAAAYRAAGGRAPSPLFRRALPLPPELAFAGVSPARIWPPERIGESELAAFARGLLSANEEVLHVVGAAALQYLDTEVANGVASVRFVEIPGAPSSPSSLVLAVRFGSSGELIAIERLPLLFREG